MLSSLLISLAQLKPGNSSEKFKKETSILFFVQIQKKQLYKSLIDIIYNNETIFMQTESGKTSEPHKFKMDLTDKLNLKNPNKNMTLANLSIYDIWENIK